jgi:carboxypeptidase C (cathepsin A)
LGPVSVAFDAEGAISSPPPRLEENPDTWLAFTDLVFVDPPATGYSRCEDPSEGHQEDPPERAAWGVKQDLKALSEFVRLYLTRTSRWLSPLFLVGESYGGFRVAALSEFMQREVGILPSGVVMVSPALEFSVLSGDSFRLLPWASLLPAYAATAGFHGKSDIRIKGNRDVRAVLNGVENFAVNELLPALARADAASLSAALSSFTGLPENRIARMEGRISPVEFSNRLLEDRNRLISLYDGSQTTVDPAPGSPRHPGADPLLLRIDTLLTAAANSLLRDRLEYRTDISYRVLNKDVSNKWDWVSGTERRQGFAGAARELKRCMSFNEDLRVLLVHGVYDLVTPYFSSVVITRQMSLDPAIAANLTLSVYEGGHMFYTRAKSRR